MPSNFNDLNPQTDDVQVYSGPIISTPVIIQNNGKSSESLTTDAESSIPNTVLGGLRVKYINRVIFAHLNINSIRNKFDMLADLINGEN